MTMVHAIDIHTHILPPQWEDYGSRFGIDGWPSLCRHNACQATIMLGDRTFRTVTDQCFAPVRRIADMDAEGISRQLLSPVPIMLCYWGPAEATAAFASMQNTFIADVVAQYPERFLGAGTVAMQSARLAIPELERIKSYGFPAIEIGNHVNGRDLDDPEIVEILTAAADLDLSVFVHPQGPSIGQERMADYYLPFMVGYPSDSALAVARLTFGGVLERLPRLRIAFAHGGGSFPSVLGRLDHGFRVRAEAKRNITRPPSAYAERLYFDTITHDPAMLALLCAKFGSRRVMLGSDYPFDMGPEHPLEQLDGIPLEPDDIENILCRSATTFLNLKDAGQ